MAMNLDLSDPDAWDDSALTNSWNEALQEYKKYHSIHVQGKKLSEVLTKEELDMLAQNGMKLDDGKNSATPRSGKQEQEHDDGMEQDIEEEIGEMPNANLQETSNFPEGAGGSFVANPSGIPAALMASVQDDSIRNLMMAWYWAGYYTGFQEGQQVAQKDPSERAVTKS